jgi:hypothetical protein
LPRNFEAENSSGWPVQITGANVPLPANRDVHRRDLRVQESAAFARRTRLADFGPSTEGQGPALRWTTLNAAGGSSVRGRSKGRQKTGRRFGVHENAKATERSKGDVVVLIACENITFRIFLQHRSGRSARLNS